MKSRSISSNPSSSVQPGMVAPFASRGLDPRAPPPGDAGVKECLAGVGIPLSPKPRILFVDDEPAVLSGIRKVLWKEPYEVLTAQSPEEAMRLMTASSNIDVIISDECMPGMSGSEFLRVVRSLLPNTPRIILTGHANLSPAMRAISGGGIFRFLTKPCEPAVLNSAIREALQLSSRPRA
ncbi:MAG: response regulator [Deltaproteobacteria bacterium]|nr:response regulator [Deltaproteobacteria bacterium]